MKTDFFKLIPIQNTVNKIVLEKAKFQPKSVDFMFAAYVEMFEFLNKIGTWKWWKHNHNLDKEKILDELADVIAFFLSFVLSVDNYPKDRIDDMVQEYIEHMSDFKVETILKNITVGINDGEGMPAALMMAECIYIASQVINVDWDEIENAYLIKSQENIDRQKRNY